MEEKLTLKEIRFDDSTGVFRTTKEQAGWKSLSTGKVFSFQYKDLLSSPEAVCYTACGKWSVRFVTRKRVFRFLNFRKEEIINLQTFLKGWGMEETGRILKVLKVSSRGCNYGDLDLSLCAFTAGSDSKLGAEYVFKNEFNEPVFDFPVKDVFQATNPTKNDLHLELADEAASGNDGNSSSTTNGSLKTSETLTEIRFYIPPAESQNSALSKTRAEQLKVEIDNLLGQDANSSNAGETICTLTDLKWLVPSGKYELVFKTQGSMVLKGKTTDFFIRYANVVKLFILPGLTDELNLVLQLNSAVRQGAQNHFYLSCMTDMRVQVPHSFKIDNVKSEALEEANLLPAQRQQRPFYDTVVKLLKLLTPASLLLPYDQFLSSSGKQAVTCSYKGQNGLLYPLKKGMIFLHKPILHIPYSQITLIQVQRGIELGAGNRFFELSVVLAQGALVHEFRQVAKEELANLMKAFSSRGVKCPEVEVKAQAKAAVVAVDEDDDDDSDYEPIEDEMMEGEPEGSEKRRKM